MQLGCPTNSSLTTTGFKASISATIISRTSFHRSTCAARPITASSTSAPTTSRERPPTTTTAPCLWRLRFSTTIASSPFPRTARNGIGGEATIDVNVANIDQTNAAFQSTGLQTFDNAYHLYNVCETTVGDQIRKYVLSGRMHAAQHRRRLYPRIRAGLVAAQLHRHDRRSLEAVRLRASRRRIDRTQRNRLDHLRELDRVEHGRELEPGGVLLRGRSGLVRPRHGGRRPRIPLSVHHELSVGYADDHADRSVHRPTERSHSEHSAQ